MASIYLITFLLIISPVFSYVIIKDTNNINEQFKRNDINNNFEISEEYPITKSPNNEIHRQKIPKRGQTIDDILPEITTFLELTRGVTDLSLKKLNDRTKSLDSTENNDNNIQLNSNNDEMIERKPLSFGDILTVLALWNLANAFNDYNVSDEPEHNSMKVQSNPWPETRTRQNDNLF